MRFIVLFALLFILSCGQKPVEPDTTATPKKEEYIGTGKLIRINTKDENYYQVAMFANDTITPNGWRISYWVKDDSTRYKDLYIKWEKGQIKGMYFDEDVLEMRGYFIPEYIGETPGQLLFWHGCATDCQAVLVCEKDSIAKAHDITFVVGFDIKLGQIVYVPEEEFGKELDLNVAVLDLNGFKEHTVTFKGIPQANKQFAIDTVIFSKSTVSITASLRKIYTDTADTKITKVVQLH